MQAMKERYLIGELGPLYPTLVAHLTNINAGNLTHDTHSVHLQIPRARQLAQRGLRS